MKEEIQKLWWLHDALWYQGVARRFGYETANKINQEAIGPVAKRAMRAVMADQGLKGKSRREGLRLEELLSCFGEASDLMWPPPMTEWEAEITDEGMEVTVTRCHAIRGIRRLGAKAMERYECPCVAVRAGWLEALGVEARQEILSSLKEGSSSCLIRLRLRS